MHWIIIDTFTYFLFDFLHGFDLFRKRTLGENDDGFTGVLMPKLTKIPMNVNNYVDLDQDFNLRNKRSRRRRYRIVSWSSSRRCSRSKLEPRWVWSISCRSGWWTIFQQNTSWNLQTWNGSSYTDCSVISSGQCNP